MDDQDQYDSVQWERGAEPQPESPPTFPSTHAHTHSALPSRPSAGRRSSSMADEPQAGDNADAVDLAGIGSDGVIEVSVDTPLKENDGTKDAYVSYLVSTRVCTTIPPMYGTTY